MRSRSSAWISGDVKYSPGSVVAPWIGISVVRRKVAMDAGRGTRDAGRGNRDGRVGARRRELEGGARGGKSAYQRAAATAGVDACGDSAARTRSGTGRSVVARAMNQAAVESAV